MRRWQIKKRDADLKRELQSDLELEEEEQRERGLSPEEARYASRRAFGNTTLIREQTHEAWGWAPFERLHQDLRYALRQLRKSPGYAITVILTLALGIGPNTAVFSVMNSVLLRPLAYPRPERIFQLEKGTRTDSTYSASVPLFLAWHKENRVFENLAAYSVLPVGFNLAAQGKPERVPWLRVSAEFFRVLGIAPRLGRDFAVNEDRDGAQPVVILSHGLWHRRFADDPAIVGKSITLDDRVYTVIGVLPEGFQFLATTSIAKTIEVWTPLELPAASSDPAGILECIGRLRNGATKEQAEAQLTALGHSAAANVPPVFPRDGVATLLPLQQRITGDTRPTILLFVAAVSFVLLIACANAANLLLARMGARAREIGVRAALGASRMRILRQILTESLVLACMGGALGVAVALLCDRVLVAVAPQSIARAGEVHIDWRVLLFATGISLLTGVVFGMLPALRMLAMPANDALRDGASRGATSGQTPRRVSSALVVAEMALSLMLLIAAGLLIESFVKLERIDPGFDFSRVTTFETTLSVSRYGSQAALERFIREVTARIEALPGVESASAQSTLPTEPTLSFPFTVDGGPTPKPGESTGESAYLIVSGDFFRTMRIPILKGRGISVSDTAQSPGVVVISQSMGRKYFPNENPIGKRIVIAKNLGPEWTDVPREIVGICGDAKNDSLREEGPTTMYTPFAQTPEHMITILLGAIPLHWTVRTTGTAAVGEHQLQSAVSSVDGEEPVAEVRALRELLTDSLSRWRFNMLLVGVFAGIALLLAAVGIYGLISYAVAQRNKEIGIRIALGASRASVLWMVIRQAGILLGAGAIAGLAGLPGIGRMLKGFIYSVQFNDASVLIMVTALLISVGLIAAWWPAQRAASVDPMQALRSE